MGRENLRGSRWGERVRKGSRWRRERGKEENVREVDGERGGGLTGKR